MPERLLAGLETLFVFDVTEALELFVEPLEDFEMLEINPTKTKKAKTAPTPINTFRRLLFDTELTAGIGCSEF